MKRISILLLILLTCFVLAAWPQAQPQTDPRLAEIAHKVVNISAAVKPGEVVVISGGVQKLALMEALAIEAAKAGAVVEPLFVTTDRLQRAFVADVPDEYLGQPNPTLEKWLKTIDVWISTADREDAKAVLEGIPETKLSKVARSAEAVRTALNNSKIRGVYIGVPNEKDAEYARVDWSTYQNMQWDAINTDYQEMTKKGNQLAKILEDAKSIRISSPAGTDITMAPAHRKAFVDAGILGERAKEGGAFLGRQASLPGGTLVIAPIENSANGKVVAPKDTCRPYEYLTGAMYVFKDGQMVSFNAKGNRECFEQDFAAYTGDKDRIASFQIGLNPALRVMEEGSEYRPLEAAGMVYIGMGNNQLLGGNNKTEFGWMIPVVKATVEVDGKTVVKDGRLAF